MKMQLDNSVKNIRVGLSWTSGREYSFDLDLSAFLLDRSGKALRPELRDGCAGAEQERNGLGVRHHLRQRRLWSARALQPLRTRGGGLTITILIICIRPAFPFKAEGHAGFSLVVWDMSADAYDFGGKCRYILTRNVWGNAAHFTNMKKEEKRG